MYKRFLMISAIILTTVASAEAKVKLPHLIADNMVLQQCSDARLWGWSDKGKTVKVAVSWSEKTYTAKAGKDGRWLVKVETPAAGYTPHTISFDDYDAISRYEDIQGFEMAGEDRVFHEAKAIYYWTKGIIITSPQVKKPVAVRYCFRNFKLGNVKNAAFLPLFPFRTDNWEK